MKKHTLREKVKKFKKPLMYLVLYSMFFQTAYGQVVPNIPVTQVNNTGGGNFNVTTTAVNGDFSLNSFSTFVINPGETYNFILPPNADFLINRVTGGRIVGSTINGNYYLRDAVNGNIAGTLIHVDSSGNINIGAGGNVRAGSALFATATGMTAGTTTGGTIDVMGSTLVNFLDANNRVDPARTISLIMNPARSITNLGTITGSLVPGNAPAHSPIDFPAISLFSETVTNSGDINFHVVDTGGVNGVPINGGGVAMVTAGQLDINLSSNTIAPTQTTSNGIGIGSVNNTVTGIIRSASSNIHLLSHADSTGGSDNSIVNAGILNTDAIAIDNAGGTVFIRATGSTLPNTGGIFTNDGSIDGRGMGGGNGGTVNVISDAVNLNPGSIIDLSQQPGGNGIGGIINFNRATAGTIDLGADLLAGNTVIDNAEMSRITLSTVIDKPGQFNLPNLVNANTNSVNMTAATFPNNADVNIVENATTTITGINTVNGSLDILSNTGRILVDGTVNLNTAIDSILTKNSLELTANTLSFTTNALFNITDVIDPSISGPIHFQTDSVIGGANVNINAFTPAGGQGGIFKLTRRTPGPIAVAADGFDIDGIPGTDLNVAGINISSGGTTGGTLIIGDNRLGNTVNVLDRPTNGNNSFGPGSFFLFEGKTAPGTDSILVGTGADFTNSTVGFLTNQGNLVGSPGGSNFDFLAINTGGGNATLFQGTGPVTVQTSIDFAGRTVNTDIGGIFSINNLGVGDMVLRGLFNTIDSLNIGPGNLDIISPQDFNLRNNNINGTIIARTTAGDIDFNGPTVANDIIATAQGVMTLSDIVTTTVGNIDLSSFAGTINITPTGAVNSFVDVILNRSFAAPLGSLNVTLDGTVDANIGTDVIQIGNALNVSDVTILGANAGPFAAGSPFIDSISFVPGNLGGLTSRQIDILTVNPAVPPPPPPPPPGPGAGNNGLPATPLLGNNNVDPGPENPPFPVDEPVDDINHRPTEQGIEGPFGDHSSENSLIPPVENNPVVDSFFDVFNKIAGDFDGDGDVDNDDFQLLKGIFNAKENLLAGNVFGNNTNNSNRNDALTPDNVFDNTSPNQLRSSFSGDEGSDALANIEISLGGYLADKLINANDYKNELDADQYGVEFSSKTGYHPRGLQDFLKVMGYVEEKMGKNQGDGTKNMSAAFSYRHPETDKRIQNIDPAVKSNVKEKTEKVVNKKLYHQVLEMLDNQQ